MSGQRALEARRSCLAVARPWWIVFAVTLFLGLNKQLDLQTLLIELGRNLSLSHGWFDSRRSVQFAFVLASGIIALGTALYVLCRYRTFWSAHRPVTVGLALVACYCLLRVAEINHVLVTAPAAEDTRFWPAKLAGIGLMIWGSAPRIAVGVQTEQSKS
jgi:hypothetical protein